MCTYTDIPVTFRGCKRDPKHVIKERSVHSCTDVSGTKNRSDNLQRMDISSGASPQKGRQPKWYVFHINARILHLYRYHLA